MIRLKNYISPVILKNKIVSTIVYFIDKQLEEFESIVDRKLNDDI